MPLWIHLLGLDSPYILCKHISSPSIYIISQLFTILFGHYLLNKVSYFDRCAMAVAMKMDDEVRLNILSALLKAGSVSPNLRQIQKCTGYHKATIKSSLDFLAKEGLLSGFGPKGNFRKFDYKLEVLTLLQADLTDKEFLKKFVDEAKKAENLYFLSGVLGSGSWNLIARHIYRDIESYRKGIGQKYFEKLHGIHDFVKAQEVFYLTEPFYKFDSRTDSLIHSIRKSKGLYDARGIRPS